MKLYNTLKRKIEEFHPLTDNTVKMYSCGPTVYDHSHIGNLSAYIFADTLHRVLSESGYEVSHAMNYTDVDDKTIRRSRENYPDMEPHQALHKLTDRYISIFLDDMRRIGNDVDTIQFIRATGEVTISDMQMLITKLFEKGFAYVAEDGVYFSIDAYCKSGKKYGQLVEISASNTSEARIQNDEYDKESIHDFALWKKQKDNEPSWSYTIDGKDMTGRPGWHIECSVMSRQTLGQPFDIHTGGVDLIFPHHENEIAQSTALEEDSRMAQFFTHNEHILVDGKKMSKSLGNFYTLEDIIGHDKGFDPLAFRLLVLQAHYRSQVNFSWESLGGAYMRLIDLRKLAQLQHQRNIITESGGGITADEINELSSAFLGRLQDDLDTPKALSLISTLENHIRANELRGEGAFRAFIDFLSLLDRTLGLKLCEEPDLTAEQRELLTTQDRLWREAKASDDKDFSKSDALRDKLANEHHIIVSNYNGRDPLWART